ncbi:Hypothetical predicted protein [Paramuricea clavata]|uniref:Uncharacterized protein n=1 Tax=Paramuricea clavata TaxID=317549 RepID=A0A6S7H420_PARCT|nr:Hypothetical predicted protein [Paramuricea clavata]
MEAQSTFTNAEFSFYNFIHDKGVKQRVLFKPYLNMPRPVIPLIESVNCALESKSQLFLKNG